MALHASSSSRFFEDDACVEATRCLFTDVSLVAAVLPLNYTRIFRYSYLKWSGRQDSNLRPHGPKPCALPS